jgi:hypothetical protein
MFETFWHSVKWDIWFTEFMELSVICTRYYSSSPESISNNDLSCKADRLNPDFFPDKGMGQNKEHSITIFTNFSP